MTEREIARLTAEVNRFAISRKWMPAMECDSVWESWKALRSHQTPRHVETANSEKPHDLLPVWEQCSTILNGLLQNRNAYLFSRPVDPIRDGVPNYFEVVKKPMDLRTVKQKLAMNARRLDEPLTASMYRSPAEFKADMDLIWENCFLYNPPGFEVRNMGAALKAEFDRRWKAMRIEEMVERKHKTCQVHDNGHMDCPPTVEASPSASGKALKKRKQGVNESCASVTRVPGKNKKHETVTLQETCGGGDRKRDTMATNQRVIDRGQKKNRGRNIVRDPRSKDKPREPVESKSNKANVENSSSSKSVPTKKNSETTGTKTKTAPSRKQHKAGRNREMLKLLELSKKPTTKNPPNGNENKQTQREWKPPIERGGGTQTVAASSKPTEKMPQMADHAENVSRPPSKTDTWKKCRILNASLRKCLENCENKREDQMTDYEVRRKLSFWLETIGQKPLNAIIDRISRDASFENGVLDIDALPIKTVRENVRLLQKAMRSKKNDKPVQTDKDSTAAGSEKSHSIPTSSSPLPSSNAGGHPFKRKRAEDEGCRLATQTPMVSPPSPPWHRRLTHKRQVWDNAVDLCGVAPYQDGSELGLTPRQESHENSWEEAIPDDVEDGEILD